ncbi:MAG: MFS transporter [Bacteroides sp.]|nr:MFS transporter [Eubacterium sp.]MCM1419555.1 MFS transporter [Roseburia sp.]MCM1461504.1 MFS transporter [Bacteroides sp.]
MDNKRKYRKTQLACYLGFVTQAVCANYAPLLFLMFRDTYKISLGRLTLIPTCFFLAQLVTDLICAKVVDRIGYRKCTIAAAVSSGLGLLGLAFLPDILPSPFAGILVSVIVYAVGSGLIEVLGSPIIEACPFENKDATMSLLHSFYCWGSAFVILGSTVFFAVFGIENWRVLTVIWAILPLYNIYNFATCPIERLTEEGEGMTIGQLCKTKIFWLFILLMICAGASELAMAQWASAFAESALNVSKTVGDLAGPCGFAVCMAISRTIYGKFGERMNLTLFMVISGILCLGCYLLAGLADVPVLGLIGCAVCGFSVGIMWPGSISISSSILPTGGTALFALLALAGDLGGSAGPAIVGAVSQGAGDDLRSGVLAGCVFPVILVICVLILRKTSRQSRSDKTR